MYNFERIQLKTTTTTTAILFDSLPVNYRAQLAYSKRPRARTHDPVTRITTRRIIIIVVAVKVFGAADAAKTPNGPTDSTRRQGKYNNDSFNEFSAEES